MPNDLNQPFLDLFSKPLPLLGIVYQGDLATAAKKIESFISKEINQPIYGMIWNETKKTFNTTPQDITKALTLIEQHRNQLAKKSDICMDDRVLILSKYWLENEILKNS